MRLGQQILGGMIGGVLSAGIWVAIAYFTGYEVAFVAWGVGLLVGLGVMSASGGRSSSLAPIAAGLIAIVAVLGGKAGTAMLVADELRHELGLDGAKTKELVIGAMSEEVLEEATAEGMAFDDEWPPGVLEDGDIRAFYPPQVWREAERRWYELSANEQMALRNRMETTVDASMGILFVQVFFGSFGLFDILWLVLATMSAFKIASAGSDESIPSATARPLPRVGSAGGPAAPKDGAPETPVNFLPMRKPDAQPNSVPLSRRGMSVEQLGADAGPTPGPAPSPAYGDGAPGAHSDSPDLNAADEQRRAA